MLGCPRVNMLAFSKSCQLSLVNISLEKSISDVILTCEMPNGYTLASSNSRKAYKKITEKVNHTEAQTACKADKAWLAMPKSSDDMADINQICMTQNKTLVILKQEGKFSRRPAARSNVVSSEK